MATPKADWKLAWIVGASSGIGAELAKQLANDGIKVAVSARSQDKLEALAATSENIMAYPLDVTNKEAFHNLAKQIKADLGELDLVILNSGAWFPGELSELDAEILPNYQKTFDVNLMGVVNGFAAVLPLMKARRRGHIGVTASIAGYNGLPNAGAYGPSKAALINMCESAYLDLKAHGIDLSMINPGFVKTPMTAGNRFPMPFLMELEDATKALIKGLRAKKFEVSFPWQLVWILKFIRILPYPLFFAIMRLIGNK